MDLSVREAQASDIPAAAALFDLYRQFYEQPSDLTLAEDFIAQRLASGDSVILVAEGAAGLLGFCQLYPSFSSLSLKRVWILNDIYVAEDARRQLVADNLMRTAKKMAKESNAVRLRVSTSSNNQVAQKTYESMGFREDTEFKNYILPLSDD